MRSLTKELFIMALLIMIVVFTIGMIFYQYMPNNKTVPEPITYAADASTTAILQEIEITSESSTDGSKTESIIKSYSIGAKELSTAASKQSYTSGKTDPFAEYTEENLNTNIVDGNTTTNSTANSNTDATTNTVVSNPNSTGTFFESKTSK